MLKSFDMEKLRNFQVAVLQTFSNIVTYLIFVNISFRTLAVGLHFLDSYPKLMIVGKNMNKYQFKHREFFL